ncbi:MAG: guanylate kinase [Legionellales bacterium RIFCSPHIGHO2_12_FULL_35_11]|nr:MAG: guanylate kinase [Legionellales bacterium RIFCSPHIGHO2_12_FULL_35_11]
MLIEGNIFIVTAPSGAGKTSLVKKLIEKLDNIEVSISHTTRKPRPCEQDAVDYYFVDDAEFMRMIKNNELLEWAKVFDYYYGTSVLQINSRLKAGMDILLAIDWQGAQQIKTLRPNAIGIFIIPPSLTVLQQRLLNRGQDAQSAINLRMEKAQDELNHYVEFDYIVVNDDFMRAVLELQSIVIANRACLARQAINLKKLLALLLPAT